MVFLVALLSVSASDVRDILIQAVVIQSLAHILLLSPPVGISRHLHDSVVSLALQGIKVVEALKIAWIFLRVRLLIGHVGS